MGEQPDTTVVETPQPEVVSDEGVVTDGGRKALAAERAARKAAEKERAELAAKVKQFEDAAKTEAERLAEETTEARARAAAAEAELLKLRIASEVGLSSELQEFLTGDREDVLRDQARRLQAATAVTDPRRGPAPDPTQGAKPPNQGPSQLTRADLAAMSPAAIDKARHEGRLSDILTGRA